MSTQIGITHTFRLDLAPRPWARARIGQFGHFTDGKTRAYKRTIQMLLRSYWKNPPMRGPLIVSMDFYVGVPMKRPGRSKKNHTHPCVKPDIDNFQKAIMDAANKILWADDAQLVTLNSRKLYDWAERRTGIFLQVTELEGV